MNKSSLMKLDFDVLYQRYDKSTDPQEKELIKENISKNKQIESETKTSIGDLIQEELDDSAKE